MAPRSAAFATAKELKEAGKTRHEARLELQLKYDRTMSKSRISQLLAHHWGPEAETSMKAPITGTKRKTMAESKDQTKSPTKSDSTGSSNDSSMARDRVRLSAKAPNATKKRKEELIDHGKDPKSPAK